MGRLRRCHSFKVVVAARMIQITESFQRCPSPCMRINQNQWKRVVTHPWNWRVRRCRWSRMAIRTQTPNIRCYYCVIILQDKSFCLSSLLFCLFRLNVEVDKKKRAFIYIYIYICIKEKELSNCLISKNKGRSNEKRQVKANRCWH